MQRFLRDERAVSQVFAFLIAGVLFIAAISAILVLGTDLGQDDDSLQGAEGQLRSESLAEFLVGSPGVGWESGADSVVRLGLRDVNGTGLDEEHLDLLRNASHAASANGKVDYEEAVASLGIDEGVDFHVRMSPVALREVMFKADLSHLDTAYIGDWEDLPPIDLPLLSDEELLDLAQDELNASASAVVNLEREALRQLGVAYDDGIHITDDMDIDVDLLFPLPDVPLLDQLGASEVEGDVFPDEKQYLDGILPTRLPQYEILVVGSGVDQSSLTGNAVKSAIKDFVLQGGILMVMGSDDANFQWLQPLFGVGTSNVNGGAYADDPSHPALWQPEPLSWTDYDNHGLGWDIKDQGSGASYDDFQHVIQEDDGDLLAISNEGAFGDGRIFLTTFRAGEIAENQGLAEALGLMRNMILYHDYAHLYLEYGAQVPEGTPVQVAVRQSHLDDEVLGQVPVRIEVLTWTA